MSKKPFVLVVEDDDRLRKIIAANLGARGYLVFQAGSYEQAVAQIAAGPKLMILDILLPDASGWDVARWARAVSASVPTIVCFASTSDPRQIADVNPVY